MMSRPLCFLAAACLLSAACATHANTSVTPEAVADCEPAVVVDEKGATLGPWIQAFREQMKRHWYVSNDAAGKKGRLTVSFRVAKDGVIDNVSLTDASPVNAHNDTVLRAIVAMSPAAPLPEAYPAQHAEVAVTVCYTGVRP